MADRQRAPVPRDVQARVYFRDGWLCTWCRRPVVFPLAFKLMAELVESELPGVSLAMYNDNWRRDKAPLLDELGACIDHIEAFAEGGAHDESNFATSCSRCNARESNRTAQEYLEASAPWKVTGKHGEPQSWEGLSSVFVMLARNTNRPLTQAERDWLRAIEPYFGQSAAR